MYWAFNKHEFLSSSTVDLLHLLFLVSPHLFWEEESALDICSILLVYSSNRYLLISYFVSGTIVGTGGIVINQIGKACALVTVTLLYYL